MDLVGGGVDSRGSYISKILYVKTKELGPLGGARAGRAPLDPPMNMEVLLQKSFKVISKIDYSRQANVSERFTTKVHQVNYTELLLGVFHRHYVMYCFILATNQGNLTRNFHYRLFLRKRWLSLRLFIPFI